MAQNTVIPKLGDASLPLVLPQITNGDQRVPDNFSYTDASAYLGQSFDMAFFDLATFQGLDPDVIWNTLKARAIAANVTANQFIGDIERLLVWYTQRGTSIQRSDLKQRSKAGIPAWVDEIRARYKIDQNLGQNPAPDHLTIARIVVVFPYVVGAMYHAGIRRPIATDPELPIYFSFPQAASMMSDAEWQQYRVPFLRCMVKFTRIINRGAAARQAPQGQIQPSKCYPLQIYH